MSGSVWGKGYVGVWNVAGPPFQGPLPTQPLGVGGGGGGWCWGGGSRRGHAPILRCNTHPWGYRSALEEPRHRPEDSPRPYPENN